MELNDLKIKLSKYSTNDIVFTNHSLLRARFRKLDLEQIKKIILDPNKLVFIEKQNALYEKEEKYNCYYHYSKKSTLRTALVFNGKIIIVTLISIDKEWQRIIERRLK